MANCGRRSVVAGKLVSDGVRAQGISLATGGDASSDQPPDPVDQGIMPSVDYEIVRLGSCGNWVEKLQEALGIQADGVFGPGTEAALKAYQEESRRGGINR